ncbi:MAG: AAA family ATPase, partial [Lachnospiraceae bacterium]|nr:AAA family ATPase [Lachnospiraceae bacterium]
MGVYLNPGNKAYAEAINTDIFVDKTCMIEYLNSIVNTKQKYVSVSRPRRFGKTLAADMICAYYEREADGRSLFEKRKIARCDKWDAYLGKFDVIRVVMTDFIKKNRDVETSLERMSERVLEELDEMYPGVKYDPSDLFYSMNKFYQKTKTAFVIVIDEWDAVFRVRREDKEGQTFYLDFLRDWLKDREYVALAYMTGILPIKKYGRHSALNMFFEYSMISPMQLASYTGFTEEEVSELCREYGRDYDKMKEWYDGYDVSDIIPPDPDHVLQKKTGKPLKAKRYSLYSPLSVVNAVTTGHIKNYWNETETYEALEEYIIMNQGGLKDAVVLMMDGARVRVDISGYQNDMTTFHSRDDVLTLLIHLGYLGYDDETKEVFIPNKEILDEFRTSTKSDDWTDVFECLKKSHELLAATWSMDEKKVAELLEAAHDKVDNKKYSDEAALSYTVQYAYYAAQKYYTTIRELDTGKGYADLAYLPSPKYSDKPALLIELKYGKSAEEAINQIKRRNYLDKFEHYRGNTLIIGVNYDREVSSKSPEF